MDFVTAYEEDVPYVRKHGLFIVNDNLINDKTKKIKPEKIKEEIYKLVHDNLLPNLLAPCSFKFESDFSHQNGGNEIVFSKVPAMLDYCKLPFSYVEHQEGDVKHIFLIEEGSSVHYGLAHHNNSPFKAKEPLGKATLTVVFNETSLVVKSLTGFNIVGGIEACVRQMCDSVIYCKEPKKLWHQEKELGAFDIDRSLIWNTVVNGPTVSRRFAGCVFIESTIDGFGGDFVDCQLINSDFKVLWSDQTNRGGLDNSVHFYNIKGNNISINTNCGMSSSMFGNYGVCIINDWKFSFKSEETDPKSIPVFQIGSGADYGSYKHGKTEFSFIAGNGRNYRTRNIYFSFSNGVNIREGQGVIKDSDSYEEIYQKFVSVYMSEQLPWGGDNEVRTEESFSALDKSFLSLCAKIIFERIELLRTVDAVKRFKG